MTPPLSKPETQIVVRPMMPADLDPHVPALSSLLRAVVHGGASLGFLNPLSDAEASAYWHSLRSELMDGSRLLLAAWSGERLIGTVQLALAPWPNARHRAHIHKLFVDSALRGRGAGVALMKAAHAAARNQGRSLLLLNTRVGHPAEHFYRALGYREIGVIPGYTRGAAGERHDSLCLYFELPS